MKTFFYTIFSLAILQTLHGQDTLLIGDKPSNSMELCAQMEIYSTSKGILLPQVANTGVISSPATGLLIFNLSTNSYNYFDGTGWIELPASNVSMLRDADNDTKISVEPTADADKVQIDAAGSAIATIDMLGLNAATGEYQVAGAEVGTLNGNSAFIGENAGNAVTGDFNNVALGAGAGSTITTGVNNTLAGLAAGAGGNISNTTGIGLNAGTLSSGSSNVMLGSNSGASVTTGNSNAFIGYSSGGSATTGSNTIAIGANSATGLVSGDDNIVIGTGIELLATSSDSLKIGNIIAANSTTGNVTFNDKYTFPASTGADGQTLVLEANKKDMRWEDAGVSKIDQTVIGSAASMYTFDMGARTGDNTDYQRNMFFVEVTPYANTTLTRMMTWVKQSTNTPGTVQMAIYKNDWTLIETTTHESYSVTTGATGEPATFVTMVLNNPVDVVKNEKYYIGVRAWNGAVVADERTDFAQSARVAEFYYLDWDTNTGNNEGWCDKYNFPPDVNDLSTFPSEEPGDAYYGNYTKRSITDNVPWVRAF